jgi:hypothetical protein
MVLSKQIPLQAAGSGQRRDNDFKKLPFSFRNGSATGISYYNPEKFHIRNFPAQAPPTAAALKICIDEYPSAVLQEFAESTNRPCFF